MVRSSPPTPERSAPGAGTGPDAASPTSTADGRTGSAVVMLALSLLAVELVAGMQTYLSQTVLPLAAEDLDGVRLYGVVNAAADAALFLTLPLGGALLSRYRIGPLMPVLTLVTVVGATLCALSTSMPVLFAARMMIARYVPARQQQDAAEKVPLGWAAVLALGAVVLSLPLGVWSVVAIVVGGAAMLRAALSALLVTTAVFFGAADVLAVVSHDAFDLGAAQFAVVIAAPSFVWALAGLWCGSHPAAGAEFRRRVLLGGGATAAGVAALLVTTAVVGPGRQVLWALAISAAVLGLGMGLVYPDLLGRCFTEPGGGDGISGDHMAASVVMAEAVGTTLVTTIAFTWPGTGFGQVAAPDHRAQTLYAALLVLTPLVLVQLARSARATPTL